MQMREYFIADYYIEQKALKYWKVFIRTNIWK